MRATDWKSGRRESNGCGTMLLATDWPSFLIAEGQVMSYCERCGCDCDDDPQFDIDNEVLATFKLLDAVYKHSSGGGNLHCVIDDGNIDGIWCWSGVENVLDALPAQLRAENRCLKSLQQYEYDKLEWLLNTYHEDNWRPSKSKRKGK